MVERRPPLWRIVLLDVGLMVVEVVAAFVWIAAGAVLIARAMAWYDLPSWVGLIAGMALVASLLLLGHGLRRLSRCLHRRAGVPDPEQDAEADAGTE